MFRIEQRYLDRLLDVVDLAGLIRQTVKLTAMGQGIHSGACPFHSRSIDGSLVVDEPAGRFACKHCQFGGCAIGWLMYHDGHSFRSAVSELSRGVGLDSSVWIDEDDLAAERADHIELLATIAEYYRQQLSVSVEARQYLHARGLNDDSAKLFGIGYASADPDARALFEAFPGRERDLWRAGLVVRRSNRSYYPRFRNRLMFPIRDVTGCIVGFGGRDIIGHKPKYLNSPTSALFNKGSILFGLDMIKAMRTTPLVVVEGYPDVIALQQAGFDRVVAPLGTAMTLDHLVAGFERSDELVLCFDADRAGEGSGVRALALAYTIIRSHQKISVVRLPQAGIDPDDLVRQHDGVSRLHQAITDRISGSEALVEYYARGVDLSGIGDCARLAHLLAPTIENTRSDSHRTRLVDELEGLIGVRVA